MNPASNDWLETWRLKAIATSVSDELQQKFGMGQFYSLDQVVAACEARNVVEHSRACAFGMFVKPEEIENILPDYGIYDPAEEWRRILAREC